MKRVFNLLAMGVLLFFWFGVVLALLGTLQRSVARHGQAHSIWKLFNRGNGAAFFNEAGKHYESFRFGVAVMKMSSPRRSTEEMLRSIRSASVPTPKSPKATLSPPSSTGAR